MAGFAPPPLSSENILEIGSFPIRNTLLASWIVMLILIIGAYIFSRRSKRLIPSGFQNLIEAVIEGVFNFFNTITGDPKQTQKFFPIVATIFLFVFSANLLGLFPGFGPIGFCEEHAVHEPAAGDHAEASTEVDTHSMVVTEESSAVVNESTSAENSVCPEGKMLFPFFRSVNSDVNMTLALALISVVATQVYGIMALGFFHYAGKFFVNPFRDPIGFFVGLLELVSEFAKIISFSFRLFGNVFAGEVLLLVISFLVPYAVPLPFYGLELFVAFIQALVFALLTLVFMKMAVTSHHGPEEHAPAVEKAPSEALPAPSSLAS